MRAFQWLLLAAALGGGTASAQVLQNPDFSDSSGWELRSGGPSGTARILGGFLELSVFFPADQAQARQRCTSTAYQRTVEVDVDDLGLGTTRFEIGWENEAGTDGDYELITHAGTASATTTDASFTHVVFRADGERLGAAAQALDNVRVAEVNLPTPADLSDFLLEKGPEPPLADANGDGQKDVADIVTVVNETHAP
jgi:hypothetical protein